MQTVLMSKNRNSECSDNQNSAECMQTVFIPNKQSYWRSCKTGDGKRLLDAERATLVHFMGTNSKNYRVTTAMDLIQVLCTLPEYYAHLSINNRCVNLQNRPDSWKSIDHMVEHLNLLLKRCHSGGQTEQSLQTLSLSLDLFMEMSANVDRELGVAQESGIHKRSDVRQDVVKLATMILEERRDGKGSKKAFEDIVRKGYEQTYWLSNLIQKVADKALDVGEEMGEDDLGVTQEELEKILTEEQDEEFRSL